jgi:uncharacterized protein YbgA (DUF1722 family)
MTTRTVGTLELLGLIEDYRQGLLPLIVPLTLLKHHLNRYPVPEWVHQQPATSGVVQNARPLLSVAVALTSANGRAIMSM